MVLLQTEFFGFYHPIKFKTQIINTLTDIFKISVYQVGTELNMLHMFCHYSSNKIYYFIIQFAITWSINRSINFLIGRIWEYFINQEFSFAVGSNCQHVTIFK